MQRLTRGATSPFFRSLTIQARLLLLLGAALAGFLILLEFLTTLLSSGPREILAAASFEQDTSTLPNGVGLFEAAVLVVAAALAAGIVIATTGWPPTRASFRPRPGLAAGIAAAGGVLGIGAYMALSGWLGEGVGYSEHTIHLSFLEPAGIAVVGAIFLTLVIAGITNRYALILLVVGWLVAAASFGILDPRPVDGLYLFERAERLTIPDDYAHTVEQYRTTEDPVEEEVKETVGVDAPQWPDINVSVVPVVQSEESQSQPRTPVFWVSGAEHIRYLRTATGDVYEGGEWSQLDPGHLPVDESRPIPEAILGIILAQQSAQSADLPLERLNYALLGYPTVEAVEHLPDVAVLKPYWEGGTFTEGTAPSVSYLTLVDVSALYYPFSSTLHLPGPTVSYALHTSIPQFAPRDIIDAPPASDATYLQLPEDLPLRVLELAEQFKGNEPPYVRANRILGFLKEKYAFASPRPGSEYLQRPLGHDPVDWFLFERRWGDSGNFSSAFVVLARAAGIPARVVAGWALEESDGPQVVHADQTHQWAEIALAGIGWVTFDPTRFEAFPIEYEGAPLSEVEEELLENEDPESRERAAEALGDRGEPEALPSLVEAALNDESLNVQLAAETSIHKIGVEELVWLLLNHEDPKVREAAAHGLGLLGSTDAVNPLWEALSTDEDAEVRVATIEALGRIRGGQAVEAILEAALTDTEAMVRAAAVRELGELGAMEAVEAAIELLGEDIADEVRAAAAWTLGALGDDAALQPLLDARSNDPAEAVRAAAAEALEQWSTEDLIQTLLYSEEVIERIAAATLLGERREQSALPALARALNDLHEAVREAVLNALYEMGTVSELENGSLLLTSDDGFTAIVVRPTALSQPESISRIMFQVVGARHTGYLRTGVGDIYADGQWLAKPETGLPYTTTTQGIPAGGIAPTIQAAYSNKDIITVLRAGANQAIPAGVVPTSRRLVSVDAPGTYWPESATYEIVNPTSLYQWESFADEFSAEQLNAADRMPGLADHAYTSLPEWAQRGPLHTLAVEITAGHATPYAQAKAIEDYLRSQYTYKFAESAEDRFPPEGMDPVEWFLFDKGEGTCGSFSSAFVLLARAIGLPARVVSGWAIAQTPSEQTVTSDQAHQWAEVAFYGLGWVTFDPTPGGARARAAAETLGGGDQEAVQEAVESLEEAGQSVQRLENGGAIITTGDGEGQGQNGGAGTGQGGGTSFAPGTTTTQASGAPETPLFRVSGAAGTPYLRTAVGDIYENGGWRSLDPLSLDIPSMSSVQDAVWEAFIAQTGGFKDEPFHRRGNASLFGIKSSEYPQSFREIRILPLEEGQWLPLGLTPTSQDLQLIGLNGQYYPFSNTFRSNELSQGFTYTSRVLSVTHEQYRMARIATDPTYVELPDSVPQRVRELALDVTKGHLSAYEKAKAIEQFLRTNYLYRFADSPDDHPPPGHDPVDWFLFEHKEGTCGVFSSAFVVMARSVGIPARVVSGWAIEPTDAEQIVQANQAHQWAEIALTGIGWVAIEATPAGGPQWRDPDDSSITVSQALNSQIFITDWPSDVRRGQTFTVSGTVQTTSGQGIHGMSIEVYVNETKEHGGIKIGTAVSQFGRWTAEVRMPIDVKRGPYQLLARAMKNEQFNESWSDPDITVYSGTGIELTGPARIPVDTAAEFSGRLTEEIGTGVEGQELSIVVDGTETDTVTAGQLGRFSFSHTFAEIGPHWIEVRIGDQEYLLQNSVRLDLEVTLPSVMTIEAPVSVRVGEEFSVTGTLLGARGEPLNGRTVTVAIGDLPERTEVTDETGAFEITSTLETPGAWAIRADFRGDGPVLASGAATKVAAREAATLTLEGPSAIELGSGATVSGMLRTLADRPLSGADVRILDERGSELAALTTDADGGFSYEHAPFFDTGPTSLTVEYAGEAFIEATSGEVSFSVLAPTALALDAPKVVREGERFTLQGRLTDVNGQPVPDATIEIGGSASRSLTTDGEGNFSWENLATFDENTADSPFETPFAVEATFDGNEHMAPSSATSELTIGVARLLVDPLEPVARGDTATIRGTALIGSLPLPGVTIAIGDDGSAESDDTGAFTYRYPIPDDHRLGAGELTVTASEVDAAATAPLIVKSNVRILVTPVEAVRPGRPAILQTTLLDDQGNGIQLATLRTGTGTVVMTDRLGMALVEVMAPDDDEALTLPFTIAYDGDDLHMPGTYYIAVPITPFPFNWLLWVGTPVMVAALGAAGYAGRRFDLAYVPAFARRRAGEAAPESETETPVSQEGLKEAGDALTEVALAVSFGGTEPDLPPVWGPGEDVSIVVRALDVEGEPVVGAEITIAMNDGDATVAVTGDDGGCSLELTPEEVGEYAVKARFEGDATHLPSTAAGSFRIVDYREEIVRLYNDFKAWAQASTGSDFGQSTPREVELALVSGRLPIPQKSLDELVSRFEEADYSEHPIERRHYASMYRAWRAVVEE